MIPAWISLSFKPGAEVPGSGRIAIPVSKPCPFPLIKPHDFEIEVIHDFKGVEKVIV